MAVRLVVTELMERFPDFRVAGVLVEGLALGDSRSAALDAEIERREAECRARWGGTELSAIPGIAAWRAAYKGFGIKKTSYRSSVERLVKRVLAGDRLPAINPLVDIYNAVSLMHGFCLGADDLDRVTGELAFRFARPGDTFHDMAPAEGESPEDPPKEGEVVYADSDHVLCRRWNWRQDSRSIVGPETRRAIVTAQANGWGDLEAAVADLTGWISAELGASCRVAIAEKGREVAEI